MIQNLRVDTIYYLTNSDFEMEFNLCGCCKMRLLTDKAENPKNFIGLLSRAVSRSQVTICCGKLFGNEGLINIVSQSIRKSLVTIDNSAYNIADANEIQIIKGSVPLVNSDGCFCGCIIESGPQAIILLTDNKSIRKTIMKSLIHPYIEELSIIKNTDKSDEEKTEETPVNEEAETPVEITEEVSADLTTADEESEENTLETDIEQESSFTPDTEISNEPFAENEISENTDEAEESNIEETEDESKESEENNDDDSFKIPAFVAPNEINDGFDLYLVSEKQAKKEKYSENDSMFFGNDSNKRPYSYDEPASKKGNKLNISILVITIVLLCALAVLAYLLIFVPMKSDYVFSEYIKNIFSVAVNIKPIL